MRVIKEKRIVLRLADAALRLRETGNALDVTA
jgi:hypothetical protein